MSFRHTLIGLCACVLIACAGEPGRVEFALPASSGGSHSVVATHPGTPQIPTTIASAPTTISRAYPTAPDCVVRDFLASLQRDTAGGQSIRYVGGTLKQAVEDGRSLPAVLGVQNMYQSFDVPPQAHSPDASSATVNATLNFAGGPIARVFSLVQDGGVWYITAIMPPASHSVKPN